MSLIVWASVSVTGLTSVMPALFIRIEMSLFLVSSFIAYISFSVSFALDKSKQNIWYLTFF